MQLQQPTTAEPGDEDALLGANAIHSLSNVLPLSANQTTSKSFPTTSPVRISQSITTQTTPRVFTSLPPSTSTPASTPQTILYLAYGSNLSAETFKGARGIQPLSSINVHVPSLDLTFDLPGIPYSEPCFANTRYRNHEHKPSSTSSITTPLLQPRNTWTKGLIGVVYEVTPADYRTIIATEGGGASYQDVLVPCYVVPRGTGTVNPIPDGQPFTAHTLLSPRDKKLIIRPEEDYAQPSARYLKLITDGAEEHELPGEYRTYLGALRPYRMTTVRQRVGKVVILAVWGPFVGILFGLGRLLADKEGRLPAWLAWLMGWIFRAIWVSYDLFFKRIFGDGERTVGDGREDGEKGLCWWGCEKMVGLQTEMGR